MYCCTLHLRFSPQWGQGWLVQLLELTPSPTAAARDCAATPCLLSISVQVRAKIETWTFPKFPLPGARNSLFNTNHVFIWCLPFHMKCECFRPLRCLACFPSQRVLHLRRRTEIKIFHADNLPSCVQQLAWYPNIRKLIKTLYQVRHNHIFLFVFTIKTFMILKILIAFLSLREFSYWTQDNIALNMPLVPLLHLFWRPLCIKILFMMSDVAKHDIAVSPCHKIHICLSPDYGYYRT